MSATAEKLDTVYEPFALVRALNRMRAAGFSLSLDDGRLIVEPLSCLSEQQRAYLRTHKAALVGLLSDAETLAAALVLYGPRLLAAGEVLYSDGRMVNRNDRRYVTECAPPAVEAPEIEVQAEVKP